MRENSASTPNCGKRIAHVAQLQAAKDEPVAEIARHSPDVARVDIWRGTSLVSCFDRRMLSDGKFVDLFSDTCKSAEEGVRPSR